jgi:hypothetical protein
MKMKILPLLKKRAEKPLIAQVSLRVHVKDDQEYHSHAYAMRVTGEKTELLVIDKNRKFTWFAIEHLEDIDDGDI